MPDSLSTNRIKPLHLLVVVIGASITLAGTVPMAMALGVSNILIDDGGIEPGESEIMNSWDSWAFSPFFISIALLGISLLVLLLLVVPRSQTIVFAIVSSAALGAGLFVAVFVHGWFFHDIHLSL